MKKLMLFFVFLAGLGFVWAGAPLKTYELDTAVNVAPYQMTEAAVQVDLNIGDTISSHLLTEVGLQKISKDTVRVRAGINIGFDFSFDNRDFKTFGITGDGSVFFGDEQGDLLIADPANANLLNSAIYCIFYYSSSQYDYALSGRIARTQVIAGNDTRISYEQADDALYIDFRNLNVLDSAGKVALKASYQYQIKKDGTISMTIVSLSSAIEGEYEGEKPYYGLKWGLKGYNSYMALLSWKGSLNAYNTPVIKVPDVADTINGRQYTITLPEPCEAITEADITWKLKPSVNSVAVEYGTQFPGDAMLVFLSDDASPLKPYIENKEYTDGQKVTLNGKEVDVIVSNNKNFRTAFTGLEGNKTYYLHAFPYNQICADGPLYGVEKIQPVTTLLPAPDGVSVSENGKDAITVEIAKKAGIEQYVIAYAEEALSENSPVSGILEGGKIYKEGGIIEIEKMVYVGDMPEMRMVQLHIQALGETEDTYKLTDLEAGKSYYVYVWSMAGTAESPIYSADYVETFEKTYGIAPVSYDFAGCAPGVQPAGWQPSLFEYLGNSLPEFEIDNGYNPEAPMYMSTAFIGDDEERTEPFSSTLLSPWSVLEDERIDSIAAEFNVFICIKSGGWVGPATYTPYTKLKDGDSAIFQVQEQGDGDNWRSIGRIDKNTVWDAAGLTKIGTKAFKPSKPFRFRVVWYQPAEIGFQPENVPLLAIESLNIEQSLPCKYPVNIVAAPENMGYGSALIEWKDGNAVWAESFAVRYKEKDGENWENVRVTEEKILLEGLKPSTVYTAEIQAVCSEGDSSAVRSIDFTTLLTLPYEQAFTDLQSFPAGYRALKGELAPAGETTEMTNPDMDMGESSWSIQTEYDWMTDEMSSYVGLYPLGYVSYPWLLLPDLLSGQTGTARLEFDMRSFIANMMGDKMELSGLTDTLHIFLSEDGTFNEASTLIGQVLLDSLKMDYQTYAFEFPVTAGSHNVIGFYIGDLNIDMDDEDQMMLGMGTLAMDSIRITYSHIECQAVTDIRQSDLTKTGVTLSWEGSALEYAVLIKQRSAAEYDTVYTTKKTYSFDTLTPGTQYAYQIFGYCEEGRTNPSSISPVRYFTTIAECFMPANFAITDVTWQSVQITCTVPSGTRLVNIYAQDLENNPEINYRDIWKSSRDTVRFSRLIDRYKFPYYVRVRTICSANDSSDWTEPLPFTTTAAPECGVPTGLSSEVDWDQKTATLSWTNGVNNDYFFVYTRKADVTKFDTNIAYNNSFVLRELEMNTVYTWRLMSFCEEYLYSKLTDEQNFSTTVANESVLPYGEAIKVNVKDRQIMVENPDARYIEMLEVYSIDGKLQKRYPVKSSGNVFVYTDVPQGMVLIRVIGSEKEHATFRTVIM